MVMEAIRGIRATAVVVGKKAMKRYAYMQGGFGELWKADMALWQKVALCRYGTMLPFADMSLWQKVALSYVYGTVAQSFSWLCIVMAPLLLEGNLVLVKAHLKRNTLPPLIQKILCQIITLGICGYGTVTKSFPYLCVVMVPLLLGANLVPVKVAFEKDIEIQTFLHYKYIIALVLLLPLVIMTIKCYYALLALVAYICCIGARIDMGYSFTHEGTLGLGFFISHFPIYIQRWFTKLKRPILFISFSPLSTIFLMVLGTLILKENLKLGM
nr:uncharacterized protein LOC125419879 [Ziziphus jujuba var. spinosa]